MLFAFGQKLPVVCLYFHFSITGFAVFIVFKFPAENKTKLFPLVYLFPAIYLRQLNINILPMHTPYFLVFLFIFKYNPLPFMLLLFNNMLLEGESCMSGYKALVDKFSCEADQNKYWINRQKWRYKILCTKLKDTLGEQKIVFILQDVINNSD